MMDEEYTRPCLVPELLNLVFQVLRNDKITLARCSLVCHAWLASSRLHLYRQLVRTTDKESSRPTTPVHFHDFLRFVVYSPYISQAVRHLRLGVLGPGERRLTPEKLGRVLMHLPRLRVLELEASDMMFGADDITAGSSPHPFSGSFQLERLSVISMFGWDNGLGDLLAVLSIFNQLDELFLDFLFWGDKNMSPVEIAKDLLRSLARMTRLQVHALNIKRTKSTDLLLQAFRRIPYACSAITSIDVLVSSWKDVQALGKLLRNAGPSVKRLVIDVGYLMMDEKNMNPQWQWLNLPLCTGLHTLRLPVRMHDYNEYPRREWEHILDILSRVSPEIRHIEFYMHESHKSLLGLYEQVDWPAVERMLLGRFDLEAVTFIWEDRVVVHGLENAQLKHNLANLHKRGLLHF